MNIIDTHFLTDGKSTERNLRSLSRVKLTGSEEDVSLKNLNSLKSTFDSTRRMCNVKVYSIMITMAHVLEGL